MNRGQLQVYFALPLRSETFPYIARRLLTDDSLRIREVQKYRATTQTTNNKRGLPCFFPPPTGSCFHKFWYSKTISPNNSKHFKTVFQTLESKKTYFNDSGTVWGIEGIPLQRPQSNCPRSAWKSVSRRVTTFFFLTELSCLVVQQSQYFLGGFGPFSAY